MSGFRRVLVAVRELDRHAAAALRKAVAVADASARIELLHVLTGPVSISIAGLRQPREAVAAQMRAAADHARRKLQRLARGPAAGARRVSAEVTWDFPVADAIVRRAQAIRADLIVAGVQPPRFAGRLLLVNTDWQLLREAPCPVLLVKPSGRYTRGPVIAAVDPFHANDKPARLDRRLIESARSLARGLGGEVHLFHAYAPLATLAAATMFQPGALVLSAGDERAYRRRLQRRFDALARRAGIAPRRRHLQAGDVTRQLADLVRRTGASAVVMGAMSRRGVKRAFIGNTAERVLDRLPCDILVVKPRTFRSRVLRRPSSGNP